MKVKLSDNQTRILCYIGLALAFVLSGDSNNVPESFIERIFRPISVGSWTFHYAGIIIILIIYYCLKKLNDLKESSLVKTTFRRVVVTIILLNIFLATWPYCTQFYKGFSKDLNAIYLNRKDTLIEISSSDEGVSIYGTLALKNCSNESTKFYLKVKTPALAKEDIKEEYIVLSKELELYPKEEKIFYILEDLNVQNEGKNGGYLSSLFEYVLVNDKNEVVFKGRKLDYRIDKWNLER